MIVPEDGIIQLPGCTLGPNQRYNGCSQYVDVHCSKVVDGTTYTSKMTGKFEWSKDGSSATGVQTITVSAPGKDSCTSTYSVWDKRL